MQFESGDDAELLSVKAAADLVRVSDKTIAKWIDLGELPYVRTPGTKRRKIRRSTLLAKLREWEVSGNSRS